MTGEIELLILSASVSPLSARITDKRGLEQQGTGLMRQFHALLIASDIVRRSDGDVLFHLLGDGCLVLADPSSNGFESHPMVQTHLNLFRVSKSRCLFFVILKSVISLSILRELPRLNSTSFGFPG